MKATFLVFLSLLFLMCGSMTVLAQDFASLLNKVEKSIKGREPDWKLTKKELKGKEAIYQWESKKSGARLLIFYAASKEEAAEKLRTAMFRISVGPDAELKGIGDEAYLWKGHGSGFGTVRFRKSNVYIDIGAPSVVITESLARSTADLILNQLE